MAISSLATKIIPAYAGNFTAGRQGNKISEITIHHMAGNMSVENLGNLWKRAGRQGSSHYGVNGEDIGAYVSEGDTAWCNGNFESNLRAISIETANDSGEPNWHVSDTTLNTLIKLVADIAKRNNLTPLILGENLTWHSMYAATACPGPYLKSKLQYIVDEANKINSDTTKPVMVDKGTFIKNIIPLAQQIQKDYKILTSLTLAQAIVETGYNGLVGDSSLSELARNANNLFGIKATKDWLGEIYKKSTKEWDGDKYITIMADFRGYDTMKDCFVDRAEKIIGMKRYANLIGESNIEKACEYIQKDGWATSPTYTTALMDRVKLYDLTQYDLPMTIEPTEPAPPTEKPTEPPKEDKPLPPSDGKPIQPDADSKKLLELIKQFVKILYNFFYGDK